MKSFWIVNLFVLASFLSGTPLPQNQVYLGLSEDMNSSNSLWATDKGLNLYSGGSSCLGEHLRWNISLLWGQKIKVFWTLAVTFTSNYLMNCVIWIIFLATSTVLHCCVVKKISTAYCLRDEAYGECELYESHLLQVSSFNIFHIVPTCI